MVSAIRSEDWLREETASATYNKRFHVDAPMVGNKCVVRFVSSHIHANAVHFAPSSTSTWNLMEYIIQLLFTTQIQIETAFLFLYLFTRNH